MDDIDRVNEQLEAVTEQAQAAIRQRIARQAQRPIVTERDCIDCGYPIAPARLKALPGADLCIDCKALSEWRA